VPALDKAYKNHQEAGDDEEEHYSPIYFDQYLDRNHLLSSIKLSRVVTIAIRGNSAFGSFENYYT